LNLQEDFVKKKSFGPGIALGLLSPNDSIRPLEYVYRNGQTDCFAALRFMMNSNLVACCTGKSAGWTFQYPVHVKSVDAINHLKSDRSHGYL
jgi:hypothetical protein